MQGSMAAGAGVKQVSLWGCRFKLDMEEKQLVGIMVPEVYAATHEVLVTQWIDGELGRGGGARHYRQLLLAWLQMLEIVVKSWAW